MKRLIIYFFTFLITLLLFVSSAIILLSYSNWGTQTLFNMARTFMPGKLNYDNVSGQLAHQITITHLQYRDKKNSLSLEKLQLTWQPQQLFYRTLWISDLQLTGLHIYHWQTTTDKKEKTKKFPFLKHIIIQHFSIKPLVIDQLPSLPSPTTTSPLSLAVISMTIDGNINWQIQKHFAGTVGIQAGKNTIHFTAQFDHRWQAQWQMAIPNVAALLPRGQGQLFSQGVLFYTAGQLPEIHASLNAQQLQLPQLKITRLSTHVAFTPNQPGKFTVDAKNIFYKQQRINNLQLQVQGTPQTHHLTLQLQTANTRVRANLIGQWQSSEWQGKFQKIDIYNKQIGTWRLQSPAQLIIKKQLLQLQHFIWRGPQGTFRINGEWHQGKYTFQEQGQFPVPPLGITLNPLQLQVSGDEKQCHYQGTLRSGNGQLIINGNATFKPTISASVHLQGNNFLALKIPHYEAWISPQLQLRYANQHWYLTGLLTIPRVTIQEPDFSQQTVTLPDDVIFVDKTPTQTEKHTNITNIFADMTLQLGRHIHVAIHGLKADITGKLHILQTPQHPATALGTLTITKGSYLAYGKSLKIKNGQLLFNHSLVENPNLQLRATKTITVMNAASLTTPTATTSLLPGLSGTPIATPQLTPNFNQSQKMTVGVDVSGTLKNPQYTLFADPPLITSQADILSYLVFDHPAGQLSITDARFLLQTTSALKLPGGEIEQITRDLQSGLGLDQFRIGSTNYVDPTTGALQQDTALILGKALSPRLYIGYSRGLTSSLNIFTASYLLSKRWSVQSTSGSLGNGVDLIYTLERD